MSSLYGFLKKSKTCAIGLIALLYIFTFMSCILPEPHDKTNVLPAFVAAAYEGKNLVSEQLRGCTFVIFINSKAAYHNDSSEKVYWDNSDKRQYYRFCWPNFPSPTLERQIPESLDYR